MTTLSRSTYPMHFIVGSANELKVEGVREVCKSLQTAGFLGGGYTVKGIDIPSGVDRTPLNLIRTKQGAVNRAFGAWERLDKKDYTGMGIGIESGVSLEDATTFTIVAVARVTDRSPVRPQIFDSRSATFPLFRRHIDLLRQGQSLGDILKRESDGKLHPNIGGGGYDALITGGLVGRGDLQYHPTLSAIISALRNKRLEIEAAGV